jgi:MFS family permease
MTAINDMSIKTPDFSEPARCDASTDRHRLAIILYSIVVGLYWMAQYVYAATLPSYVQSKTSTLTSVGMVLSMYGLCQALVRLPVGICTDWIGWRKPFILAGLTFTGIGAWLLGTAHTVDGLVLGRAVTGVAAGAWVPMVVAFSSLFPPKDSIRAAGFLILLQASGRVLASAANGPLNLLGGYRLAFYVAVGISVVALLFALMIREPRRPSTRPSGRMIGRLIIRRDVLLPSLLAGLSQAITWGVSLSFIPIVAKQVGGTDNTQSVLAMLAVVTLAAGSLSMNVITKRIGPRRVVTLSLALMASGCVIAALAESVPRLIASQICLGLGLGFAYPGLMGLSIRNVIDRERTIAMGLHQTLYAMGMFVGPAVSGALAQAVGIHWMFATTGLVSLALGYWGAHSLATE